MADDIEAADQMTYESTAVHQILTDLCHALGLNNTEVAELVIKPGAIHATFYPGKVHDDKKTVAYSYPIQS